MRGVRLLRWSVLGALLVLGAAGCTAVRFNQMKRLGEPAMKFDADPLAAEMVGKILTSREAAAGGFFGSSVGGCACN